ncbi:SusC/RagA family TonB-linked outer membrane protein [Pseudoflavitalea rhizosphaerae]|uniref:SusC/RagA family TonB-linked outer membrane protein n=1 Tax=Pseudoflavitalea rhizosphaerae TaxID=1884793 RepID=UPI000F8ED583|nr:SusC/RagA family TonB-linked outer membrane protein [Pseudoflavitalea rhizosphaerae]
MQKTAFDSGTAKAFSDRPPQRYRGLTKTLLVVKLIILLTVVAFFQVQASGTFAQTVTISGKDLTLKQVFAAIEKQTNYVLLNTKGTLDGTNPVSLTVHKMPLREFLDLLLKDEKLDYEIQGKTILLSRKVIPTTYIKKVLPGMPELFPVTPPVKGAVFNENGTPLSGVSVVVKKTKKGTVTDASGNFSIQADKDDILIISYVGYVSQEVKAGDSHRIIKLKVSHSVLDETQITAYGKTSRRMATGNIGTITAEEIERQPVMTALEAMIGKIPGVEIRQTSGNAAAPVQVIIRGRNTLNNSVPLDPLYVIDGMPLSTVNSSPTTRESGRNVGAVQAGAPHMLGANPLLGINPKDIESISVLKDADATAIYGSRGANGVILITTKKGKQGPAQFSISINNATKFNGKYPRLMNTQEYLSVRREALLNDGLMLNHENARDLKTWDTTKYTDWQRMLVGTGSATSVNASVSGGMGQSNYFLSAGYDTQKEIMNNGGRNQRGSFNARFSHASTNQKFRFDLSNRISLSNILSYSIGSMSNQPPNAPDIYDADGNFNFTPYRQENNPNGFPFAALKRPSKSKTFELSSNLNISYQLLKGLTLSAGLGHNFTSNENSNLTPKSSNDPAFINAFSSAIYGKSTNQSLQVESQLGYNGYIGKGKLSAQLIANFQQSVSSGETITSIGFPNDAMMKSHNNAQTNFFAEGYREYKYLSGSAIVKYEWDNKYVISLNARRDGSSRFGPGKQFGNFGSIGLAWIASDENWMKKILPDWFSLVKFRASTGVMGSDGIGEYEYLPRWSKSRSVENNSQLLYNYNGTNAFHAMRPLNQNYQWESTRQTEIGTLLGFFQNRINVELAYYSKYTDNQLTKFPIPSQTGFASVLINHPAGVRNSGVEISASAELVKTNDWNLHFNINTSRNRNKLVKFPGLESSSFNGIFKVGQSLGTRYFLHYTGVDPLTGNYTFEDHNKDGLVNIGGGSFPTTDQDDRYVAINTDLQTMVGSGITLSYKSISVAASFVFVDQLKRDPSLDVVLGTMQNTILRDDVKNNHWTKPGDQAKYPRYTTDRTLLGNISSSDAVFIDGSYLRMTNLAISWALPADWINRIKIKGATISLQTQNLFTLSNYPGIDPGLLEAPWGTPVPRTISTNLSLTF